MDKLGGEKEKIKEIKKKETPQGGGVLFYITLRTI